MLSQWEYLLTHRLVKRAAVNWYGLYPLPTWDFFHAEIPDVTVAASMPQAFDATVKDWAEQALEVADDLAKLSGARLNLPTDPIQKIIDWTYPTKSLARPRRIDTVVSLSLPRPRELFPLMQAFSTTRSLTTPPTDIAADWIAQLRAELPSNIPADWILDVLSAALTGATAGLTLNTPEMTARGVRPSSVHNVQSPFVYVQMDQNFTPILVHELGHATIPKFLVDVDPNKQRWLHSELSTMAALHRIMPILVNNLRQRLGESPYTAAAIGQMLAALIANQKAYLNALSQESESRLLTTPSHLEPAHVQYAMDQLSGLNQLTDPWGQAVLTYAQTGLTGKPAEDPHISRTRANVQDFLVYLAASANNPSVPIGALNFAQLLERLAKIITSVQKQTADPQKIQMYRTAIKGPESLEELANFLDAIKKLNPDVVNSIPYKTLYHMLNSPKKGARILQRTMQYPKLVEPVTFK